MDKCWTIILQIWKIYYHATNIAYVIDRKKSKYVLSQLMQLHFWRNFKTEHNKFSLNNFPKIPKRKHQQIFSCPINIIIPILF